MVDVHQGDVFWVDLADPRGSEPGFRRPVVVVQGDALNRSKISTVVCVALTSNLAWADAPGNLLLKRNDTGLAKDCVANTTQIVTLDRDQLVEKAGALSTNRINTVIGGIGIVLGQ